jgi:predicted TIM-barrel fold metal-dependent hydrolase
MKGKIALEEHFAIEATLSDSEVFGPHVWPELRSRLLDIQTKLVTSMDAHGVGRQIHGYKGHNWLLGPSWAFNAETSAHALRLIGSGIFDECPNLKLVLGHLGEGIPALMWRIDHRNGWMKAPHKYAAKNPVADYFRKHFWLTTSGNYSTSALKQAIEELGSDRVMFSVDWPFEDPAEACDWIDKALIAESDRQKIGRDNAIRLFKLSAPPIMEIASNQRSAALATTAKRV